MNRYIQPWKKWRRYLRENIFKRTLTQSWESNRNIEWRTQYKKVPHWWTDTFWLNHNSLSLSLSLTQGQEQEGQFGFYLRKRSAYWSASKQVHIVLVWVAVVILLLPLCCATKESLFRIQFIDSSESVATISLLDWLPDWINRRTN